MQMTKGLLVAVCAQLLLFVGVHSVPLSTSEDNQLISEGANHLEGFTTEDQDSQTLTRVKNPHQQKLTWRRYESKWRHHELKKRRNHTCTYRVRTLLPNFLFAIYLYIESMCMARHSTYCYMVQDTV